MKTYTASFRIDVADDMNEDTLYEILDAMADEVPYFCTGVKGPGAWGIESCEVIECDRDTTTEAK